MKHTLTNIRKEESVNVSHNKKEIAGVSMDPLNLKGIIGGIFEIYYLITARNYVMGNVIFHF